MVSTGEDAFAFLEGKTLSAVTFIWNYYQFLIGTETLSVYSDPIVLIGPTRIALNNPGYRDALCDMIGKQAVRAVSDDDHLELRFNNGNAIYVSFRPEHRVARELQESLVATNPEGSVIVIGDSEPSAL
jgi:hypothetical protein